MIKTIECGDRQSLITNYPKNYTKKSTNCVDFFIKIHILSVALFLMINTMRKTIDTPDSNSTNKTFRNFAICAAIWMALTSCWSRESKINSQQKKITQLEYKLQKQAENYHKVYIQENIQQDLKAQWADNSINQEIGYALNYADKQDKKIARTKRRLNKAQKRLSHMQERWWVSDSPKFNPDELNTRLTDKYDYISEEFERGQNRQ